jgi:hypothetical protein
VLSAECARRWGQGQEEKSTADGSGGFQIPDRRLRIGHVDLVLLRTKWQTPT